MSNIQLYNEDCLIKMKDIPDKSIDMILCDLPYEVLKKDNPNAQWDRLIPLDELWEQYNRIIKDNGAIVLFAQGMFTAKLMMSNPKMWRYNLIWDKQRPTGFLNANKMPMRCHEDICVFYKRLPTYNPQMTEGKPNHSQGTGKHKETNQCYGKYKTGAAYDYYKSSIKVVPPTKPNEKFPQSIISIQKEHNHDTWHPTQKTVALLEYLIKTFSNENDTVLDNTMGSGSTGVACINTNRNGIGIELNEDYFKIAQNRVKNTLQQPNLF